MASLHQITYIIAIFAVAVALAIAYTSHISSPTPSHNAANNSVVNNTELISPGPVPVYICPLVTQNPVPINITNYSGLSVYHIGNFTNYVMRPGGSGRIVYSFNSSQNFANRSLSTTFYHRTRFASNYTITKINATSNSTNQTSSYSVCYSVLGNGTNCFTTNSIPSKNYTTFNASSNSHWGVNVHSTVINQSYTSPRWYAGMNLSANQSAQQGTYWITIGGSQCYGGQLALLTIGNSAYSGQVSPGIYS